MMGVRCTHELVYDAKLVHDTKEECDVSQAGH